MMRRNTNLPPRIHTIYLYLYIYIYTNNTLNKKHRIKTTTKLLRAADLLKIPIYITTQNRARLGNTVAELHPFLFSSTSSSTNNNPSTNNTNNNEKELLLPKPLVKEDIDKTRFSMYIPPISTVHFPPSLPLQTTTSSSPSSPSPSQSQPQSQPQPQPDKSHDKNPTETKTLPKKQAQIALVGIESHICVTQTALDLLAAGHKVYVLADGVSSSNPEEVSVALARLRQAGAVVTTSESWIYECMGDAAVPEFRAMVKLVKETVADTKVSLQALLGGSPHSKI